MKNVIIGLLTLLSAFSLLLNFRYLSQSKKQTNSISENIKMNKVTRVIDGDTFDIDNGERIRILEIDAPELPKGCMSSDAKDRLDNLVSGKAISYEQVGKDNFGRILAYVYVNKLFINEIIIEEGLAFYYKPTQETPKSLSLQKLEEKAKLAGRGIWSSLCQTKKDGCVIKGNYRSSDNTRIYHTPDCYNYDKITIKPGTTDRWFCTEIEAQTAGFRKSLDCPK
ncbi:MAG: thermonuclease family protein [bacterium]|nr:thermonuclease family protein [bacterium]